MREKSLLERFLEKVRVPSADPETCWEWTGTTAADGGYGQIHEGGKGSKRHLRAHRYAWFLANGPIPAGLCVLHRCDNPACVRPSHLELGTRAKNNYDMARKDRAHKSLSGLPRGVFRADTKREQWGARTYLGKSGCYRHLGYFPTIEQAAAAVRIDGVTP